MRTMKWFKRAIVLTVLWPILFLLIASMMVAMLFAQGDESGVNTPQQEIIPLEGKYVGPYEDNNYSITQDVKNPPGRNDHKGIDLSHGYGAKIVALCDAEVYLAKSMCSPNGGYLGNWCPYDAVAGGGNYVALRFKADGEEYYATYMHMSEVYVTTGQSVKAGQVIGLQGHSGNSSGSHLHLEVHHDGLYCGSTINWVNPRKFLDIKAGGE